MLRTSQDLLFIVIAIAVLWLTVFFSIILCYILIIIKQGAKIAKECGERFKKIDEIIGLVKEKIEHSLSSFAVLIEGIKGVADFLKARKQANKKK